MKNWCFQLLAAFFACLFFCGCATSVENNYLKPEDFARCLEREGLPVESVRKLSPDPFRASVGCGIRLKGVVPEIGIYKYDQEARVQRNRLERIRKAKCTYVLGVKFPVVVHGSFMIFGLDKNPQKRAVLKALEKFQ